jgi:hypothetical protein
MDWTGTRGCPGTRGGPDRATRRRCEPVQRRPRSHRMTTDMPTDGDELDGLDWVVWEHRGPRPRRPDRAGRRRACRAGDDADRRLARLRVRAVLRRDAVDEVPYYSWLVRVPRHEHLRRNAQGTPVVVAALHAYLRTQPPAQVDDWQVRPDRTLSRSDQAGRALRRAHDDLLDALEVALLGLRRDGAQDLDPEARCWWREHDRMAGIYTLWLCRDPDVEVVGRWLLVTAGAGRCRRLLDQPPRSGAASLRRQARRPGAGHAPPRGAPVDGHRHHRDVPDPARSRPPASGGSFVPVDIS